MAAHNLAVVLSKVDNHVTLSVGEGALLGLRVLPFLRVARSDLAKFVGVAQDGNVVCVGQLAVVGGRAKVSKW